MLISSSMKAKITEHNSEECQATVVKENPRRTLSSQNMKFCSLIIWTLKTYQSLLNHIPTPLPRNRVLIEMDQTQGQFGDYGSKS